MLKVITANNLKEIKIEKDMIVCPDAQMHPNEQYEYAKELIQKAKDKDITIVTFSAILIHSLEIMSKFFNIKVDFYLLEDNDFILMNEQMNVLYHLFAWPYELLTHISIDMEFGLNNYSTIEDWNKLEKEAIEYEEHHQAQY